MERKRSRFYTDRKGRPSVEPSSSSSSKSTDPYTPLQVDVWTRPKHSEISSKHNRICEICLGNATYVASMDAKCVYCNVLCHVACLEEADRVDVIRGSWVCQFCQSDIEADKSNFLERKLRDIRVVKFVKL
jgi:hypothetical protein